MADIRERFSTAGLNAVRAAIDDAGGNEVFLLGSLHDGKIGDVRVLARGNRTAVPAILQIPRPGEVVVHNHPSGTLVPSHADIEIASALGKDGIGSYIVDNAASDVYVIVEPLRAVERPGLDAAAAAHTLGPHGAIAAALPDYEHRPQQLAMLSAVAGAFNDQQVLTVEAGTGTGKSLAYLVPAILWSKANKERVVVSTHTINLQEQLVRKDLPFLTERAGLECRVALVKGRGNYLCQRKAAQAEAQGAQLIEDDIGAELRQLLDWAKGTRDGSLADLAVRPRPEVWEQVVSENDNCLRARCPYYSSCFFYSSRRAAAAADVVVVNHHLLMADLALRDELDNYTQNAVLPPATRVIIDEAHHLEDVATSYFGSRASLAVLDRTFGRLQSRRNLAKGVLPALMMALESIDRGEDVPLAQGAVRWIEQRLLPQRASLAVDAEEYFTRLLTAYQEHDARPPSGGDEKLRITDAVRGTVFWQRAAAMLTGLAAAVDAYAVDFEGVLARVAQLGEGTPVQVRYLATELGALRSRLAGFAATLLEFVGTDEAQCRWLELRPRTRTGPALSLHTAPIDVAPLLHRALFQQFETVVLTSATLAVDQAFDYLHQRVGVARIEPAERVQTLRVESPFDFARQARLLVPSDLPEPTHPGYEAATHEAIRLALHITDGGAFVLFTSYGALRRAFAALAGELGRAGLTPLQQGDTSRQHLLARFAQERRAVLFATDSFWEGVDVKGDALRCVIIARLPFKVPTEPIEAARVEAIEARGGNPFMEHALPQAVLKLKQGFGRLIRSRSDCGCVLVLDSRVAQKRYGQAFLRSLPPARQVVGPSQRVFAEMEAFFRTQRGAPMADA